MQFQIVSGNVLRALLSLLQLETSCRSFLLDELVPCLCNTAESYLPFRKQDVVEGLDKEPTNSACFISITTVKNHTAIAKPMGAIQCLRNSKCDPDDSKEQQWGC